MEKNLLLIIILLLTSCIFCQAQTWEEVAESPFSADHSIGFSLNGIGYTATGNSQDSPTNLFYAYDPVVDLWTDLGGTPMPSRGFGIGATWNGKAYLGFGAVVTFPFEAFNDLWSYDPATDTWTELASCPCGPRFHPAFVTHNGKIFVGMGGDFNTGDLNDWWEYDIASDTWSEKPEFPSLPRHHPYQFAIGDYVYTGFGHGEIPGPTPDVFNDWYRYDPATEVWEEMADLPAEGRVAGTQFSYGNKGYILSGEGEDHGYMDTGEFWEYDPALDEWTELPPHPGLSRWAPTSFIIDNYVYLVTGETTSPVERVQTWRYNLDGSNQTNNQNIDDQKIKISPNPTVDFLTIQLTTGMDKINKISLYNINGQALWEEKNLNDFSKTINIQHIPVGMYIIKVSLAGEIFSRRIVKQ